MTGSLTVDPVGGPVRGSIRVPGSRSISNRALACAALASGESRLSGLLHSDDTDAMAGCLGALGVAIGRESSDGVTIQGCGGRPAPGPATLFTNISGTTSRFVLALAALGEGPYRIDAGAPMRARPMGDGIAAVRALGAQVVCDEAEGHLPLWVHGGPVRGGAVSVPGDVSSQFLSGLLLAGPAMADGLVVDVVGELKSRPYVDMTVAVMTAFGAVVAESGGRWSVEPGGYRPSDYEVEPDASSAAYFAAAAAVTGGTVRLDGIDRSSIQGDVGFLDVLAAMGASVVEEPEGLVVDAAGGMRGGEFDFSDISDQAPTAAVVAAFASGPTRITGIGFIRRKESDRIAAVVEGLHHLGVEAAEEPDGFVVHPVGRPPHGGRIETYDDHRLAMSFAVAGLVVPGVEILDPSCVAKTYPGFFDDLAGFGRGERE